MRKNAKHKWKKSFNMSHTDIIVFCTLKSCAFGKMVKKCSIDLILQVELNEIRSYIKVIYLDK